VSSTGSPTQRLRCAKEDVELPKKITEFQKSIFFTSTNTSLVERKPTLFKLGKKMGILSET
jgi:hypothetical protein